jgi:hypothetical protein
LETVGEDMPDRIEMGLDGPLDDEEAALKSSKLRAYLTRHLSRSCAKNATDEFCLGSLREIYQVLRRKMKIISFIDDSEGNSKSLGSL